MTEPKSVDPLQGELQRLIDEKRKVESNLDLAGEVRNHRLAALEREISAIATALGSSHV